MNFLMAGPWVQTLPECHPRQIHKEELAQQWEDLCHASASERVLQACWLQKLSNQPSLAIDPSGSVCEHQPPCA